MAHRKTSTRIGTAEREAAQRALHEHLNAGRLQVNEYAERTARAADATTASHIADLFTDLPDPRPKLPGMAHSSLGGLLRNPLVVGAGVLALAGLALALSLGGRDDPPPSPASLPAPTQRALPPVPTTTSVARPTMSTAPSGVTTAGALPGGDDVRRTTGTGSITLRPSYGVDLDNNTSPNWAVTGDGLANGHDIAWRWDASSLNFTGDFAVVTGAPEYETCAVETGYTRGGIDRGSLQAGENICVRTSEDRYALVTVVGADEQAFEFRTVVWDSVIPS
jgi:hypothetical protein